MTRSLLPILCASAALLIAGCTTDDPGKGGLFGGLAGLFSGSYEERVSGEAAALKTEEARYQDAVDGRKRLDRELEDRRAQASDLKGKLASLRQEAGSLDAEITALQLEESVTREQVENAEADVASLVTDIDRIETEQEAHEQAKALGADAGADSDPANSASRRASR